MQKSATFAVNATGLLYTLSQPLRFLVLTNDGPNTVYAQLDGQRATTESFPILSGEAVSGAIPGRAVALITDTGNTASVRMLAYL